MSYPNAKAKHLAEMSRQLVDMFGGEVPEAADDLEKLAGVGRKTANVIRAVWFGHATMAVDTHVYRVSHRMGLVPKTADTPRKVEDYLMKHIPAEDIPNAHHWILLHGRYICKRINDSGCIISLCNGLMAHPPSYQLNLYYII